MRFMYLAAAALALLATPAIAGGCCGSFYDSVPIVPIVFAPPRDQVTQIYVVNQGPVLSGPGLYTHTNPWVPSFTPPGYGAPYRHRAATFLMCARPRTAGARAAAESRRTNHRCIGPRLGARAIIAGNEVARRRRGSRIKGKANRGSQPCLVAVARHIQRELGG